MRAAYAACSVARAEAPARRFGEHPLYIALIIIALVFAALALARIGGARRRAIQRTLARHGIPLLLGVIGAAMVMRGQMWLGLTALALALVVWQWPTAGRRPAAAETRPDPADAHARAMLGVGPQATAAEIRAAFRDKMRQAHPDRGGSNDEAARLVAARDRLLRRK